MIKENLCKCNKCDVILIDQNPQINAPEFNLIGNELNMAWSPTKYAWVCPKCRSDAYLTDIDEQPSTNVQGFIGQQVHQHTHTLTRK